MVEAAAAWPGGGVTQGIRASEWLSTCLSAGGLPSKPEGVSGPSAAAPSNSLQARHRAGAHGLLLLLVLLEGVMVLLVLLGGLLLYWFLKSLKKLRLMMRGVLAVKLDPKPVVSCRRQAHRAALTGSAQHVFSYWLLANLS